MSRTASGKIGRSANSGRFTVVGKSGHSHVIQGAGSMKGHGLKITPGVDLTKPIASQVLRDTRNRPSKKG
jgi:hypothetical protein